MVQGMTSHFMRLHITLSSVNSAILIWKFPLCERRCQELVYLLLLLVCTRSTHAHTQTCAHTQSNPSRVEARNGQDKARYRAELQQHCQPTPASYTLLSADINKHHHASNYFTAENAQCQQWWSVNSINSVHSVLML